jgi:hypothetical protein
MIKTISITILIVLTLLIYSSVIHAQGWYDRDWDYRKAITINASQVDANLTNFPVLITITDTDLELEAKPDGTDILFTGDNGTAKLDHEIEAYAAGVLVAWVEVPTISSSTNTIIYLYYGNSAASSQENPTGVWNGNYVMVHHLKETSGNHNDSTLNSNDGTMVVVTDQAATGNIVGADEFDGTDDYIRVPDAGSLQFGVGSFTAEAWIYPHSVPDSGGARIVNTRGTGTGGSVAGWQLKIKNSGSNWYFSDASIDDAVPPYEPYDGTITYPYNQWYHVVMVYDAVNDELLFYVDSAPDGTLSLTRDFGSIPNALPTVIGASLAAGGVEGTNNQFFDGIIDEVRLSNEVRSAEWISASYRNQNNPGGFYSVGDEEISSIPPTVADPDPADGAINVSISLPELRFTLHDPDGDPMTFTVTTAPDIGGTDLGFAITNGTYSVPVSGLAYETTYQWDVSVTDGIAGGGETSMSYSFTTGKEPAVWWDSGWLYRRVILLDHTDVAEDLTNFPVLIAIDDGSLLSHIQDDADDIAFTGYDGTPLNHEVEGYDPLTGKLIAWVSVPFLSSSEDTQLYLYYGNSGATNQENGPGVWDSNYVMVQHLDETSGTHFDSTGNPNDGTAFNLASQDVPGKIDGADAFDASGDLIDVGTDTSLDVFGSGQDFSIFLWAKRDAITEVEGFFSSGSSGSNGIFFGSASSNTDDLKFLSKNNTVTIESTTGAIGDTEWHHVGVTADRAGDLQFWVDGVSVHAEDISTTSTEDWNRVNDTYKIGTDRSETSPMDGILDEVRVSDMVLGAGWIQTSYTNQNNPGAFYLLGGIEIGADADDDGIPDELDNCLNYPNGPLRGSCTESVGTNLMVSTGQFCTVDADCDPGEFCEKTQADTYPPGGNGIGDACDCEADFDCDDTGFDVDALNVGQFLWDFGRSLFNNPCTAARPCFGDVNCDGNVDAGDVPKVLEDFGRTIYVNPCPACIPGDWCVYVDP